MPNIHSSINFALVNIPVIMNPIIKNNDTSFNQLHKKYNTRINYIKFCPKWKVKIKEQEIIKEYEYEKNIFNKKSRFISKRKFLKTNKNYFEEWYFKNTNNKYVD